MGTIHTIVGLVAAAAFSALGCQDKPPNDPSVTRSTSGDSTFSAGQPQQPTFTAPGPQSPTMTTAGPQSPTLSSAGPQQPSFSATGSQPPFPNDDADKDSRKLPDGEITAAESAAMEREILEAQVAERGAQRKDVKDFARTIIRTYRDAEAQNHQVAKKQNIEPVEGAITARQKSETSTSLTSLRGKSGMDLDRAYIDGQVESQTELLGLIDRHLLPSVVDPALKAQLEGLRRAVATHLEGAKDLQKAMPRTSAPGGGAP